jgi:drug/metabolite transporter (DMT)-like permease
VGGALAALAALTAVGSSFAVLDELRDYPAAGGQAVRYAIGAALLVAVARGRVPIPTRRQLARLALLAATGLAAFNLLVMAAEHSMDPGSVGVIVATVPVLLAIAGPLQARRRIDPRLLISAVVVAAGAAAVQGAGGEMTALGLAAALGALLCEAAFSLVAVPLIGVLGPLGVSVWAAALAVPLLLAGGLVMDGPQTMLAVPTADEAFAIAYLALAVTAIGFVLWYSAVQALGVERAGLFSGAMPVAALLCAAALGGSALTPGRLFGVLAVAAGIVAGMAVSRRRAPTAEAPAGPDPAAPAEPASMSAVGPPATPCPASR